MSILNLFMNFLRNEDGFLGGLISGGLSLLGGLSGNKAHKAARGDTMMGFNYLKGNRLNKEAQSQGFGGFDRMNQASGLRGALLGLGGDQGAAEAAFDQYRNSTGYDFRLNQGMEAIEGSRAARGILNSGAAIKDLNQYGADMASSEFGSFLDRLVQEESLGGVQADRGLQAVNSVGSAGSAAGQAAAQHTVAAAENKTAGLGGLIGGVASIFGF